jgi:hypothetical protein
MTSTDGGLGTQASVGLRAGGGAAILVFGTLGVALPFLLRRLRDGAPWLLYTKAAAAGVVLALALVHLINDAFSTFAELEPGAPPLAAAATQHVSPRCPSSHAAQPAASRARPCCGRDCALGVCDGAPAANARRGGLGAARCGLRRCDGVDILRAPPWRSLQSLGADAARSRGAGSLYNDFPIAGVFVVAGVYVMFLTERVSLDAMAAAEEANCESEARVPVGDLEASDGSGRFADGKKGGDTGTADPHSHEHLSALSAARSIVSQHAGHSHDHDRSPSAAGSPGHGHAHGALVPWTQLQPRRAPVQRPARPQRRRRRRARPRRLPSGA